MMKVHDLVQGSDEWHQFRLNHFGASEAGAMLGLSTKVKRNELLHMKFTCTAQEFSDWVQKNILDKGHELEALARPIIEDIIGADLYPVTCSEGIYSASCDGLTLDNSIVFEHKQFNKELFESIKNGVLPEEYIPQCQQILFVTRAKNLLFVCSDGTKENMVIMDVKPDQDWWSRIKLGWAQFFLDLKNYNPVEIIERPDAAPIMQLPALVVQVKGEIVRSNLTEFTKAADHFLANINTTLTTDQEFADAKETVKFLKDTEKKIEAALDAAIAQMAEIDELRRVADHVKGTCAKKRLMLDKLVVAEEKRIKADIEKAARESFLEHVRSLEEQIKPISLVYKMPDFQSAMKNKRTIASLKNACDTLCANEKIVCKNTATEILQKVIWFESQASDYKFLFHDIQTIIYKPIEDFKLLVLTRCTKHKEEEEAKAELIRQAQERQKQAMINAAQEKPVQCSDQVLEQAKEVKQGGVYAGPVVQVNVRRPDDDVILTTIAGKFGVSMNTAENWIIELAHKLQNKVSA